MKKLLQVILFLLLSTTMFAQQEGRMETDRPDQTESPFTVKHKYFQMEAGVSFAHENGFPTFALPTILWKYGLTKKLELRLFTEINYVETPLAIPDGYEIHTGLVPIAIGGK